MAARRMTRKQMRRDEFVTAVGRVSAWAEEHSREALIGLVVLVALAAGVLLMIRFMGQREEKASMLLARGIDMFHAPIRAAEAASAPAGDLSFTSEETKHRAVLDQMDAVLQTYPRSRAARLALYYRGLALSSLGKSSEAVQNLESFLSSNPDSFVAPMARAALAQALSESGQQQKAFEVYEQLSRGEGEPYPPQAALLEMGLCLEQLGKKEEARKLYAQVSREYPGSDYSREADERLKAL